LGEDLNVPLLNQLKLNLGKWMTAGELGLSSKKLPGEIQPLTRAGGQLERDPDRGVRLCYWPDRLHPDELSWELGTKTIGRRVLVFNETASTNDVAWRHLDTAEPEGIAVFAESQARGRGRHGRPWHDVPGKSVLVSVLLRPRLPAEDLSALSVLGALAVCEAVESVTGVAARVKWPNDVLAGTRKLAGVLVEARAAEGRRANALVLGIGLNVNQEARDFPPELEEKATSLRIASGRLVDRVQLCRALLRQLDRRYRAVLNGELEELENAWRARCTMGEMIDLEANGETFTGRVVDLSLKDGLLLQLPAGGIKAFRGEHVCVAVLTPARRG